MKRCVICGEIVEDDVDVCPVCGAKKFTPVEEKTAYACEHIVGDGVVEDKEVMDGLHAHFTGECTEVGMYLAMSRVADREGYPEVAEAFKRYALEEAEHAAKFAELLGEVVTPSTKKNLEMRAAAEAGKACEATWLRRYSRHRSRNGKGRGASRRGLCWSFEKIFR